MKFINSLPKALLSLSAATVVMFSGSAFAQKKTTQDQEITGPAIVGSMIIDFKTRYETEGDQPKGNVRDQYVTDLWITPEHESYILRFKGAINRLPELRANDKQKSKTQQGRFEYNLDVFGYPGKAKMGDMKNPQNAFGFGSISGVPYLEATTGEYHFDKEPGSGNPFQSPLRFISPRNPTRKVDNFSGIMKGLATIQLTEKQKEVKGVKLNFWKDGKQIVKTVSNSDPINFNGVRIPYGPQDLFSDAIVTGDLNYDYDSRNWLTEGITIAYSGQNGKDIIAGTIKYFREENYYDFNLQFNPPKPDAGKPAEAVFEDAQSAESIFTPDLTVPTLTGTIKYKDDQRNGKVVKSEITYDLKANRLTQKQLVAFMKVWLLIIGPMNDE